MKFFKVTLLILWMGIIFIFSNDSGYDSVSRSNSIIDNTIVKIYEAFNGKINSTTKDEIIKKYSYPVRKLAHFTEYFILGILIFLVLSDYNIHKNIILYCILFCLLYALSDEFHQSFISGRVSSIIDVLIDTMGSITSISLIRLFKCKKQ